MEVDVTRMIGAAEREVRWLEKDGKPACMARITRLYDTSAEDLWEALTSKERIPRWFTPIEGDLRLGGRFQLKGNASGSITACSPPTHYATTWEFGGGVSWLEVFVAPEGGKARLTLEHVAHVEGEHWNTFGPGAVGIGWDLGLMGLALHVEQRDSPALDPADGMAWMGSPNGKAFMRASGEGWRDADVQGGRDPVEAKRRSDATIAAYTGEGA